jgi:hypothetical protein
MDRQLELNTLIEPSRIFFRSDYDLQSQWTRKSEVFVMDKGYHAEKIHHIIPDDLEAYSLIPVKHGNEK